MDQEVEEHTASSPKAAAPAVFSDDFSDNSGSPSETSNDDDFGDFQGNSNEEEDGTRIPSPAALQETASTDNDDFGDFAGPISEEASVPKDEDLAPVVMEESGPPEIEDTADDMFGGFQDTVSNDGGPSESIARESSQDAFERHQLFRPTTSGISSFPLTLP